MVEATDLRDGDHFAAPRRLDRARVGAILVERKMRPSAVVVIEIRLQDATQMAPVEDDGVVETLAADRTDHPFDVRVLPRRPWCSDDLCEPHRVDAFMKASAIRCVTVSQQIAGCGIPWERFGYLARQPTCGGLLGDIEPRDSPAIVGEDRHHVEEPKRGRHYDKHVDGGDALGLIAQEATPRRRRCIRSSHHVLGDCRLADFNAELEDFAGRQGHGEAPVGA